MNSQLEREVRDRARHRCEYCRLPETASTLRHVVDHVIARQHGGATKSENLALCCGRCNLHKGPNIAGVEPDTGQLTRLFHPRHDVWDKHFRWDGPRLVGVTGIGRTTIAVLRLNDDPRVSTRIELIASGRFNPA